MVVPYRGGNRRAFRLPGEGGGPLPLYGGTFARSNSVSNKARDGVSGRAAQALLSEKLKGNNQRAGKPPCP